MLNDGLIGSKATGMAMGSIGSAIYTYLGSKTSTQEVIPSLYHYIKPEPTQEERDATNQRRLVEMAMNFGSVYGRRI